MPVTVTEENIRNANALFWEQMLAMHVEPVHWATEGEVRCIGAEHIVGSCDLAGVWIGRIEVRLSHGLAMQATSAMLMQPVESVQSGDALDAIREIANMIAGTIKSALPRPCTMTVPSAEVEPADFCILPRTDDSVTVFFRHTAGELMVRVWQQTTGASSELDPEPTSETYPLAQMCA
jgi:CheY-specific phosphatase CheX